ncbi:MAG: DUF2298 domain-containing protein, partial [bacterium]|nr:DUF2298 domain-containing protein [bacterium]
LGFRIAKVIDNPPQFLGWEFRTDLEDETARIYDHPKVIIFEKTQKFSVEQLQQLILSPPAWVGEITAREILTLQDGYPVYATPPAYPIVSWILLIQVLGWMAFIAIFPLCAPLPDRGYAIAKITGIAVFAWACWYLASIHLAPFSRMQAFVVFFVLLLCVTFIERRYHTELWAYVKERWLHLAGVELLFFALFFFFLAIRVWHPSIFFGEKPMNFSFINAVYRTDTFPPEDPWICNYPINYYYYGQAVFSILGRFIGLPPEYLFNLAGVTVTALAGLAVFTLAFALSRKVWVGLLAVYLSVFSAHWLTYVNIVKYKNQLQEVGVVDFLAGFVDALIGMGVAVKTLLGLRQGMMDEVIPNIYDTVFWNARNVFLGTAASEFPYWTHLFMDFHAHMLVMSFTLAFLALLYAYFAQPRKQIGNGIAVGYVAALALLLGTVICTNTWDLPALLFSVLFVMALKFWRESELLHGRATNVPWLAPETWQSLGRFPLMPTLAIFALALFLMYPFFFWFDSRVTSVGLMTQGNTPVSTYLGFFIHLLFPVITLTVLLAITRLDGKISKARTLLFGVSYMGIFLLAAVYTLWNPFGFQAALPYMDGQPGLPMNYMVVGLFSPFLVVLFLSIWQRQRATPEVFALLLGVLALGLSMGIEFFYIKENWGEPNHRWNTLFKFNLQIWQYLSILAAVSILMVWRLLKQIGISVGPRFTYASRGIFLALAVFLVAGTVPFTVMAPAIVSQSGGAFARDARPPRPTLDGLAWLRVKSPGDYAAVQWLKRFVPGTPNIVELADRAYFEDARFSSNTGLPAILGWPHHVGERKHEDQKMPRKNDVERIYLSQNKQEVVTLLGQYQVEYLMFGELERSRRRDDHDALPPFGPESLARFEKWGDVFSLIFRDRGTSIFKVNTSLNSVYGLTTRGPQLPPAKQPPVMGNSMFEGGSGVSFGAFNEPRGLCEDASGFFYVADTKNNRIQVFRPSGDYAWNVGVLDGDGNEFKEPNDITIDPQTGDLFIADTWNQRVVRLNKEGTFIGAAAYDFFGPRGLVFHPGNRLLYICDTGHSQIKVLTPDGEQRMVWGQKGSGDEDLNEPVGIDVLPNGNLAILDSLNKRVKIYTPDGQMVRYWPIQTTWGGNGGFEGHLACSADSMVFVTDPKEASVHVYTESGELTGAKITTSITGEAMRFPVGVIMTSRSQVLVTDMVLRKVLRIR